MVSLIKFNDGLCFDFAKNKSKQKMWIEALLHFTKADINHLAVILDQPPDLLTKVHRGEIYLSEKSAKDLAKLFLLTFAE